MVRYSTKERQHDLRHGVVPRRSSLTPADRVRLVHHLLTSPYRGTEPSPSAFHCGAGVRPYGQAFPHVIDMLTPHDHQFGSKWLRAWSKVSVRSMLYGVSDEDIQDLRYHMGGNIAMYFAFLNYYFLGLMPAAVMGVLFWLFGTPYNPMYSFLLILWATALVDVWRIRQRKLAARWGSWNFDEVAARNEHFRPSQVVKSSITGDMEETFAWWRRDLRLALVIPVTLLAMAVMVAVLCSLFLLEVIAGQLYDGPGRTVVALLPTVLFSLFIPQILGGWRALAKALTQFENHKTMSAHRASLMIKIYAMQSLVTLGNLFLTAYVYVPFGERILNVMHARGYLTTAFRILALRSDFEVSKNISFKVPAGMVHSKLFAMVVTQQISNTANEVVVPMITRALSKRVAQWRQKKQSGPAAEAAAPAQKSRDQMLLERVEEEFALPVYDEFDDYAEMVSQFTTITMWSVIWPLAPVFGYVNNFFELRTDSLKLVREVRRPTPRRSESIGRWLDMMYFAVRLAVLTNASLVYLYEADVQRNLTAGYSVLRTGMHPELNSTVAEKLSMANAVPYFLPRSSTAGAMVASILCAVVCHQLYTVLPMLLHHLFENWLWRSSQEYEDLVAMESESRRTFVDRMSVSSGAPAQSWSQAPQGTGMAQFDPFWAPAYDTGRAVFADPSKTL